MYVCTYVCSVGLQYTVTGSCVFLAKPNKEINYRTTYQTSDGFSCTYTTNPFHIKEQKQVDHSDDTYHGSEEETKPTRDSQTHAWYL